MSDRTTNRTWSRPTARLAAGVILSAALAYLLPTWARTPLEAQGAACLPPISNPIVCENSLPGNSPSEWDVAGAGDPTIQGFATDISVNKGQTVSFKVATTTNSYRIDIYRLGYYDGDGARKVATVFPSVSLPQNQPSCLSDAATGLVDCGNWAVSASWNVPSNATSGVYIARLVRTVSGGASHIVFIVRDDQNHSDLLFQTSDTTWQAYNDYGGNSLYGGSPAGRAYKVSYNRPFITRGNQYSRSWLFAGDYPMLRWLEANGYWVSYTTGIDTDRRGAELLEHEAFLSVGHDEYWSAAQRTNVEAARAAGVNLAFFSGNEMFWKTRYENSLSSPSTAYRTLVSYKETHANAKIDPTAAWTGTWRDPRFSPPADGGQPENALTGTLFMGNCCAALPLTVSADQGKARFWRNTSLASLAQGQTATIAPGIVGYEFDADFDNGFRPQGLLRLSASDVNYSQTLLDYGSTFGNGSFTHALTLYRHSSGALVFGAGTTRWSWALDVNHIEDDATPDILLSVVPEIQQATVNLLADMGSLPLTLQPGLVASGATVDTSAPTASFTNPLSGDSGWVGTPMMISGLASDSGGVVSAVEVSLDNGASWRMASGLANWTFNWMPAASGAVTLRVRAIDDSGNIGTSSSSTINVATPSCPCPTVGLTTVGALLDTGDSGFLNGSVVSSPTGGLVTTMSVYVGPVDTLVGNRQYQFAIYKDDGGHPGQIFAVSDWGTLVGNAWNTLPISATLSAGTPYWLIYVTNGRTASVNNMYFNNVSQGQGVYSTGPVSFGNLPLNFPNYTLTTARYSLFATLHPSTPDTAPPSVIARTPAPGATGVVLATPVTAMFSETMTASTITTATAVLRTPANAVVPAAVVYDATTRIMSLTPAAALSESTTYTVTLTGGAPGIKDAAGNPMAGNVSWSFTTADLTAPTVSSLAPANGSTGVTTAPVVTVVFSEDMLAGTVTGSTVELRNSANALVASTVNYISATRTATLTPTSALSYSASYTARVHGGASGVKDLAGNPLAADVTSTFSTMPPPDVTPPIVTWINPMHEETGVPATPAVTATFNEDMTAATVTGATFELRDSANALVPATVSYTAATQTATLTPVSPLGSVENYTVHVKGGPSGVKDLAGNALASDVSWTFLTKAAVPAVGARAVGTYDQGTSTENATTTAAVTTQAVTNVVLFVTGSNGDAPPVITDSYGNAWAQVGTTQAAGGGGQETPGYLWVFRALGASGGPNHVFTAAKPGGFTSVVMTEVLGGNVTLETYGLGTSTALPAESPDVTVAGEALLLGSLAIGFPDTQVTFAPGAGFGLLDQIVSGAYWNLMTGARTVDAGTYHTSVNYTREGGANDPPFASALLAFRSRYEPADTDAPEVTAMTPADGSTQVAVGTAVTIVFSEEVDAATVSSASVELRNAANALVPGTLSYASGTVTFQPSTGLGSGQVYTARVMGGLGGVRDLAGNPLAATSTAVFTTIDTIVPVVTWMSPAHEETGVAATTAVSVMFSEDMAAATVTGATFELRDSANALVPATVSYTAATRTALLTPASHLAYAASYTVHVKGGPSGVQDLGGNVLASDVTSTFVTKAAMPALGARAVGTYDQGTSTENATATAAVTTQAVTNVVLFVTGSNGDAPPVITDSYGNAWAQVGTTQAAGGGGQETPGYLWVFRALGASGGPNHVFTATKPGGFTSVVMTEVLGGNVTLETYGLGTSTGLPAESPDVTVAGEALLLGGLAIGFPDGQVTFAPGAGLGLLDQIVSGAYWNLMTGARTVDAGTYHTSVNYTLDGGAGDPPFASVLLAFRSRYEPADTTAPEVTSMTPADGSAQVATGTAVTIVFSEEVDAATISSATVELRTAANAVVPGTVSYASASSTVTFQPSTSLGWAQVYTARVMGGLGGVRDLAGNPLAATSTATFTTIDTIVPVVTWMSPANGTTGVAATTAVSVMFSEDMAPATVTGATFELRDSANALVPATVNYTAATRTALLIPASPLAYAASYTVHVKGGVSGVQDLGGNVLASDATGTFVTKAAVPAVGARAVGTYDQGTSTENATTTAAVTTQAVTNVVLFVTGSNGDAPPAISDSYGNAWTQVGTTQAAGGGGQETPGYLWVFRALGASGGPNHVFTAAKPTGFTSVVMTEVLGGNVTLETYGLGTRTTLPAESPNVTVAGEALLLGGLAIGFPDTQVTFAPGAGFGLLDQIVSGAYWNLMTGARTVAAGTYHTSVNYTLEGGAGDPPFASVLLAFRSRYEPADTTAPAVTSMTPADGSAQVATGTAVTIVFSEAVDAATISSATVELRNAANAVVPGTLSYASANYTATLQPSTGLGSGQVYTARVIGGLGGVRDLAGNALAATSTAMFTTIDTIVPVVTWMSPSNGATGVPATTAVSVMFSEDMAPASVIGATFELRDSANALVPATVSYTAATRTAMLMPASPLTYAASYTVHVKGGVSGVQDLGGNVLAADVTSTFVTKPAMPAVGARAVGTYDQGASTENATVTAAVTTQAATNFVLFVTGSNGDAPPAISDSYGNAWAQVGTTQAAGGGGQETPGYLWVFRALGASGGPNHVFTAAKPTGFTSVVMTEVLGGNVTLETYGLGTSTTLPAESPDVTVVGEALLLGGLAIGFPDGQVTFAPGAGFGLLDQIVSGAYWNLMTGARTVAAGTYRTSVNYTLDGGTNDPPFASAVLAFKSRYVPGDTTAPLLTSVTPQHGETDVVVTSVITAVFSEDVDPATVSSATLQLLDASDVLVPATVSYTSATHTATIQPVNALGAARTYTVRVTGGSAGVRDLAGNALALDVNSSFTTLLAVPTLGAHLSATYDSGASTPDATITPVMTTQTSSNFVMFVAGAGDATPPTVTDSFGNAWALAEPPRLNGGEGQGTAGYLWTFVSIGASGGSGHTFTASKTEGWTSIIVTEILGDNLTLDDDSSAGLQSPSVTVADGTLLLGAIGVGFPDAMASFTHGNGFVATDTVAAGAYWNLGASSRTVSAGNYHTSVTYSLDGGQIDAPEASVILAIRIGENASN